MLNYYLRIFNCHILNFLKNFYSSSFIYAYVHVVCTWFMYGNYISRCIYICIYICKSMNMHLCMYKEQMLIPSVFTDLFPLYLLRQSLSINRKLKNSCRLASQHSPGTCCLCLLRSEITGSPCPTWY